MYEQVLSQIELLESEADKKARALQQQMQAQQQREESLNQYQQMVVALMQANNAARADAQQAIQQAQQHNRELSEEIEQKDSNLASLRDEVKEGKTEMQAVIAYLQGLGTNLQARR